MGDKYNLDGKHGTYHLSDNARNYEISRSNNFEFIVTDLDNLILKAANSDTLGTPVENAQEVLRLSVTRASVPHFTQNVIEIRRGNSIMKAAGVPTFESGTLVVNDFIGVNTKQKLIAWRQLSYNVHTEKIGKMIDYKKDCELLEYTPDYTLVRSWLLKGCWISGLSEDDYSMESGDKRMATVTIQYDRAIPTDASDEIVDETTGE